MRLLTTHHERRIRMRSLRKVSKAEKLTFVIIVTIACVLLVPAASALIAMLMFGNFLRECGVTERLNKAAQNEIINVVTIFLGSSVGITMTGERFLQAGTLKILALGVVAFAVSTAGGVLMAKLMNLVSRKNPINPLIGSAGVSAVPMAARVSQVEGQKADPDNFLLMHAMGPNVAGVIGTAVVAGYFIARWAARSGDERDGKPDQDRTCRHPRPGTGRMVPLVDGAGGGPPRPFRLGPQSHGRYRRGAVPWRGGRCRRHACRLPPGAARRLGRKHPDRRSRRPAGDRRLPTTADPVGSAAAATVPAFLAGPAGINPRLKVTAGVSSCGLAVDTALRHSNLVSMYTHDRRPFPTFSQERLKVGC
jgi:hypothetical protein